MFLLSEKTKWSLQFKVEVIKMMQIEKIVKQKSQEWLEQPMLRPKIGSVILNMSLGKAGDPLNNGKQIIEALTEQKPVETYAKQTWRKWSIRKGQPVGAKVTVRGEKAYELLLRLFHAQDYKIKSTAFDKQGNFSFGISEHIDIPGMKYEPGKGIIGFNVIVQLERIGYRVKRRKYHKNKIPQKHHVSKEDAIAFLTINYKLDIE